MVYRSRKYKKRSYGRKRFKKAGFGSTAMRMARTALRAVNFVRTIVNAEKKEFQTTQSTVSYSNAGFLSNLNLITEGNDTNQRNGRSIKAASIMVRFTHQLNTSATVPCRIRVMMLIDTEFDAVLPSTTDVLQSSDTLSPLNILTTDPGRFKVLRDKSYSLYANRPSIAPKFFCKLNHHIKFVGATGTNADCASGAVLLLFITDAGVNVPTFSYNARLRYFDN